MIRWMTNDPESNQSKLITETLFLKITFQILVFLVPRASSVEDVESDMEKIRQEVHVGLGPTTSGLIAEGTFESETLE